MGMALIRKTIPTPTSGTTSSVKHAPALVRAMGQRVFETVLQGEETTSASPQSMGEEMALMQAPPAGDEPRPLATGLRGADPSKLQAVITAAYLKASALGSGTTAWKNSGLIRGTLTREEAVFSDVGDSTPGTLNALPLSRVTSPGTFTGNLGSLAAQFESGSAGIEAVGYDPGGGTSYGMYQIASRTGTMSRFLDFLAVHEPRWAERLRAAGPADTGSTQGAMPRVWKSIAKENPERFASLQQAFIRETHYEPARQAVEEATGIDINAASRAVQEVLWSAAVQHGPGRAADMFIRALSRQGMGGGTVDEAALIQSVYQHRGRAARFFLGNLRDALMRRFQEEKAVALAMLREDTGDRWA